MMRFMQFLAVLSVLLVMTNAGYAAGPIDPHGKPANAEAGKVEHYDLWQDEGGWHLRTTTKEYDHHFRGVITASGGEFVEVKGFRLEHKGPEKDYFKVGPEHHEIKFDFSTKGSIDGVDFRVKGKEPMLSFSLLIGEKEPTFVPARIFIGKGGAHPEADPFELPAHGK